MKQTVMVQFNAVDFLGWCIATPDATDKQIWEMYLRLCDTERQKVKKVVNQHSVKKEDTVQ